MEFWEAVKATQKKDDSTVNYFKNKNGSIKDGEEVTFYYGGENHDLNEAFLNEGVMKNINEAWYIIDQYDTYRAYPDSFMIEYESIKKLTKTLKIKRNILKKFKKELLKTIKFLDKIYFKIY
jgi:hypothetical protein